jgi:hypothetical protein
MLSFEAKHASRSSLALGVYFCNFESDSMAAKW